MLTFQYPVLLLIAALCCQSCCLIIHFGAVTRRCNYVTSGGGRQLSCEKGSFLKSRTVCNSDLRYVQGRSVTLPVISSSNNVLHSTTQFLRLQIFLFKDANIKLCTVTVHLLHSIYDKLVSHNRECLRFHEVTMAGNLQLWSSSMLFRDHLPLHGVTFGKWYLITHQTISDKCNLNTVRCV